MYWCGATEKQSSFSSCFGLMHHICHIYNSTPVLFSFYFSVRCIYIFFPVQITIFLSVTWRPFKKLSELTGYEVFMFTDTLAGLHTLHQFFGLADTGTEHIAGGGRSVQTKNDASLSDLPGGAECVCVCGVFVCVCMCVYFYSPWFGKNAQLQQFFFCPGYTRAEQWQVLCGCRNFSFPGDCRVLSEGRRAHELQSEYDPLRVISF